MAELCLLRFVLVLLNRNLGRLKPGKCGDPDYLLVMTCRKGESLAMAVCVKCHCVFFLAHAKCKPTS